MCVFLTTLLPRFYPICPLIRSGSRKNLKKHAKNDVFWRFLAKKPTYPYPVEALMGEFSDLRVSGGVRETLVTRGKNGRDGPQYLFWFELEIEKTVKIEFFWSGPGNMKKKASRI